MAEYYDIVLGAIPISLVAITGSLMAAGLSLTVAVPLGSVVSVGLIGHAMFVNGPVDADGDAADPTIDDARETADDPASEDATGTASEPQVGTSPVAAK